MELATLTGIYIWNRTESLKYCLVISTCLVRGIIFAFGTSLQYNVLLCRRSAITLDHLIQDFLQDTDDLLNLLDSVIMYKRYPYHPIIGVKLGLKLVDKIPGVEVAISNANLTSVSANEVGD